jgi:chaperone BCS1
MVLNYGFSELWHMLLHPFESIASYRWRERVIEYSETNAPRQSIFFGGGDNLENTDRNYILQKALRLYINETYPDLDGDMDVNLLVRRKMDTELEGGGKYLYGGGQAHAFSGSFQQLQSFVVARLPKKNRWALVDSTEGIHFLSSSAVDEQPANNQMNQQPTRKTTTVFRLKAYGENASKKIDSFVDRAFAWYQDQKRQEQENERKRMFFLAVAPEESKDNKKTNCEFKQYPLSDHKTFKSLFFPEKAGLLSLVDDFVNHRGKFSIEGFPQKLGILLDGPPGTGKTSLIKALAHYTNRHIISVNLAKVKTNQELMDLFFDMVFPVRGSDVPLKLKFSQVVFVMEDVDAASSVVYARKTDKDKSSSKDNKALPKLSISRQQSREAEVAAGTGPSTDKAGEIMEQVVEALTSAMAEADESCDEGEGSGGKKKSFCGPFKSKFYRPEDDLNLSGLLNVIDGVVDAPDRILIMTTNHPEKLDPALIRPGRINKKLRLGHVDQMCLRAMVEHYLQVELTDAQQSALDSLLAAGPVTPAQVEQCCAEANSVEDFVAAMKVVA